MTSSTYRSSRPDSWTSPRPVQDANQRFIKHGPIQPMDHKAGFFSRLLR